MPTDPSLACSASTIVLKLGGSVLASEGDLAKAVHECYRWSREGYRVVAVVSAIGDTTDRLVTRASAYGHAPSPSAYAALVATGEVTSAAHLWLACDAAGLDAVALDASAIGLRVEGPTLDATPVTVHRARLQQALDRHAIVIVPGFVGVDASGRQALLGRGGSDLTAIVLAHALRARCRLVKDVPGLFERDPARPGPFARRYAAIRFDDAERLDGAILQSKALRYAQERGFAFEVAALAAGTGTADCTVVGAERTRFAPDSDHRERRPKRRFALLGFGVVGRGVWQHLRAERDRFEAVGVAVRTPKRHADAIAPRVLRTDAIALAGDLDADLVIETMGGTDLAHECVAAALRRGADVITANKSLVARYGAEFASLAHRHGGSLRFSAAVGGAAPCLEAVARSASQGIVRLDGILNGTTNVMLARIASGASFDEALSEAQALGFAESDPSADVDGTDAFEKITLLARVAFGDRPHDARVNGIRSRSGSIPSTGPNTRLVASAWLDGGRVRIEVAPRDLSPDDPLLRTHEEWNRLCIHCTDGSIVEVSGKGAGRLPTAEAVVADAFDLWRAAERRPASASAEVLHA